MRERCKPGSTVKKWARYAGRGITVCAEWGEYADFKTWALAHGYTDELTIDRIDNDGNYEPANCEWVTKAENNRRMNALRPPGFMKEVHRRLLEKRAIRLAQEAAVHV